MFEDPDNHQYAYTMKFLFAVSNNKVKYESLLAGLRMPPNLKVSCLHVRSDSQVVMGKSLVLLKQKRTTCNSTWCVFNS